MDLSFLESLNEFATKGLVPDLTVLLDLDAEEGLNRKRRRWDSFEREDYTFHRRVRDGYLKMAAADPERWMVVDGSLPAIPVEELIWERIKDFLTYGKGFVSLATSSP